MNGNLIFSQTSWGRNELNIALQCSMTIPKTTIGSEVAASCYIGHKLLEKESLELALVDLSEIPFNLEKSTTPVKEVLIKVSNCLRNNIKTLTDPEDMILFNKIVNEVIRSLTTRAAVGRKQLRTELLRVICNHI